MSSQTHTVDTITRIYKNANNHVIGIHTIEVIERPPANPHPIPGNIGDPQRFTRGYDIKVCFTCLNLHMDQDRTIAKVQMLGAYDDFLLNSTSSDILEVTYTGKGTTTLKVSLHDFPTIGDTV